MKAMSILRVYRILKDLEDKEGLGKLGGRARTVLRLIGELEEEVGAPTVGDIVTGGAIGSAPTAYATLDELQKAGWIERVMDGKDSRARRVQLSPKARKTFNRMSRRFLSAFSFD